MNMIVSVIYTTIVQLNYCPSENLITRKYTFLSSSWIAERKTSERKQWTNGKISIEILNATTSIKALLP